MNIIKNWAWDILGRYKLRSDPMLLTFLYEAADICFFFDHEHSRRLPFPPLLGIFRQFGFYYRGAHSTFRGFYVVPELYESLQASRDYFLFVGILFVK